METLRFLLVSTFYPPYHLGGDAVHVQYLAEALAAQGHEVHIEHSPAAYRVKRRGTRPVIAGPHDRVHVHPLTRPSQSSSPLAAYLLGRSHAVSRAHERLVREVKPDVVHLHNISLLGLGVLDRPAGRPLLYTAHDYWFRCPRSDLLKLGRRPCESPACFSCMLRSRRIPPPWRRTEVAARMNGVQCVIAPSRFMKNLAEASFPCPVVHIPNFVPDANPSGSLGSGEDFFLYAGVLEPHKGIRELLEAARAYRGRNRFIFVGQGSQAQVLREAMGQPDSRVELRPWPSKQALSDLYRNAAAFVLPSTWFENGPLAAIEALSWGTPLLATSRGGVPELLDDGGAGLAFEPTAEGIGRALKAFDERGDAAGLRRGSRHAYETHHTPESYLAQYYDLLEKLLSGPGGLRIPSPDATQPADPLASEVLANAGHHR